VTFVALSNFIGNIPFQLAADTYHHAGFDLTFGDNARLERLIAGDYQIAAVSMNSVLLNLEQAKGNLKVVYAYVSAVGNGSDLIVCRTDVNDAAQLGELQIGVQRGSLEHFIFEYLFFLNKVRRRLEHKWLSRSEYGRALRDGEIDAAVFCDPALSQILGEDGFRLFGGDMKEVVLSAIGVIAVRQDLLTEDAGRIVEFVSILADGIEAVLRADNDQLKATGGAFVTGIEFPKTRLLDEVAFLSRDDNRKLFEMREGDNLLKRCSKWLEFLGASGLSGVVTNDLTVADILDGRIVSAL
jgi:hypothetical protein